MDPLEKWGWIYTYLIFTFELISAISSLPIFNIKKYLYYLVRIKMMGKNI